jgi:putative ABC transport system permease protein
MALPLAYNLRNLTERKTTTLMTALGIALTVSVLLAVLALVNGLSTAFRSSANPLNILVLRSGSDAEINSGINRAAYQDIKLREGIARNTKGEPMASLELVSVINMENPENPNGANLTVRGLLPIGVAMRGITLAEGRWFEAGKREVTVGKGLAKRYPGARMGSSIHFGKGDWEVVGIMDGGQSTVNSEIFGDLNLMAADFDRSDGLSCVLIRATDQVAADALMNTLIADQRLNVNARTERAYFESQTISSAPVQALGVFVSIIMAIGSSFAAMNTMYAAVARRAREIGTLRVLGFSRSSILTSFFIESVLLAVIGGIIGCLLVLPLNNITTGIGNFISFSEISFNFRVTPAIMAGGVFFAMLMGAIGGLFPARMAAKKEILTALREI